MNPWLAALGFFALTWCLEGGDSVFVRLRLEICAIVIGVGIVIVQLVKLF